MGAESNTIIINEIMYDPIDSDYHFEWIELYNPTNETINLTNWTIQDNTATDTIQPYDNQTTMLLQSKSYALITDKDTEIYNNHNLTNETLRLTVDDNSIGNGLGNTQDCLILFNENNTMIDAMKWGYNYSDIPGIPSETVPAGTTLSRINDTQQQFIMGIPTPGKTNTQLQQGTLNITLYPTYVPKIYDQDTYGFPIAAQISIQNYTPHTNYELKAYITKNETNTYPATQTWDGGNWQYSDRYCIPVTTDEHGDWQNWVYLRFNKDYKAYQETIQQNNTALLQIKLRTNSSTDYMAVPVSLLDMDITTGNATPGGYYVNISSHHNQTLVLTNQLGMITGIAHTEPNTIDEPQCNTKGYYRVCAPVGSNYTLSIYNEDNTQIRTASNITIRQGRYEFTIQSAHSSIEFSPGETITLPVVLKNTGSFTNTIEINLDTSMRTWKNTINTSTVTLRPNQLTNSSLQIHAPSFPESATNHQILTITATSIQDPSEKKSLTLSCTMHAPELTIKKIKCYNQKKQETNNIFQGEHVRIKAFLKNQGDEPAEDVTVHFYYDALKEDRFIGKKHYDSVTQYQKYPSIIWDTHTINPGLHTIYVLVDEANSIKEKDEYNNMLYTTITLLNTTPSLSAQQILLSEIYYYTHSGINNEYMMITNPTNKTIDLSGWYLTTTPNRPSPDQRKIIFPENTLISDNHSIIVTQNASAFLYETGYLPDFEYAADSLVDIPNCNMTVTQYLSNNGCALALKNGYNHTIDLILYGNISESFEGWNESSIPSVSSGEILIRKKENHQYCDTNRASDWIQTRYYSIGQSRAALQTFSGVVNITTFVSPDCSYEAITNEIARAQHSIDVNMYEFTHPFLCDALIQALKRGISVRVFMEGSPVGGIADEERFLLNRLYTYGADIRFIVSDIEKDIHARYLFDHAKYLIIDNETVIVESCNWAKTGVPIDPSFGNREWGIIIRNTTIASYYSAIFTDDWNPYRCDSISYECLNLTCPDLYQVNEDTYYGKHQPTFESIHVCESCIITPVFSPDTSLSSILALIESAEETIYIQQLYIHRNWGNTSSPLVDALINKSKNGVDIRIILNYNPRYKQTNQKNNETIQCLRAHNISIRYHYTNWSIFTNLHNKGVIVDNKSVLISSINWNEQSLMNNREAGVIIENIHIASFYASVFFYDWYLNADTLTENIDSYLDFDDGENNNNSIYIITLFIMTFTVIARDWRKRPWT